ncbi:hypothetical protein UFOVP117_276 [uncultured Caudovirales phage]|uniref:Uncharacterized protein n=1 Tax=uncultured Caudovirales phage TaxID=2100421 RepID=A0A6J5L9Q5_9CAUD|nr:hypothetical protein UFOVP117_276 [uncultured Caudovirales phage]
MKYIITESKLNNIFKLYMDATYGDVEMAVDKDDDGYIHFFSRKDIDSDGYPVRIAHRNNNGTLWIDYSFFEKMRALFGNSVGEAIEKYYVDKFGIEIKRINMEF